MRREKNYRNNWNSDFHEPRSRQNKYFDKFKDAAEERNHVQQKRRDRRNIQRHNKMQNSKQSYVRNPFGLQMEKRRNDCTPQIWENHRLRQNFTTEYNSTDIVYNSYIEMNATAEKHNTRRWRNSPSVRQRARTNSRSDNFNKQFHTSNADNNFQHNTKQNMNWQMGNISVKSEPMESNCYERPVTPLNKSCSDDNQMSMESPQPLMNSTSLNKSPKKRKNPYDAAESDGLAKSQQTSEVRNKRNISSDDVVCLGPSREVLNLDDLELQPEFDIRISTSTNATQTEQPAKKQRKKKKDKNVCELCNAAGHTEHQCMMICKNCNQPYHNMRTCPLPNQSQKTLSIFLDYCMQQFMNTET